jgi:type II secretory pathway predicted ATPase ExeA
MSPAVLCELRLLASARFESQSLLCVVLAGDARLLEKLRREELTPLGSRIRTRLATETPKPPLVRTSSPALSTLSPRPAIPAS